MILIPFDWVLSTSTRLLHSGAPFARSGAPLVTKFGYLCIREILVLQNRPSLRTYRITWNFRDMFFAIQENSQNFTDSDNKCLEHNMPRKLSDSHYVNNQERTNLLPLKRLQNHIFLLFWAMSWSSLSLLLSVSSLQAALLLYSLQTVHLTGSLYNAVPVAT